MSGVGVIVHVAFGAATALSASLLVFSGALHARASEAFRSVVTNQALIPFRWIGASTVAFTGIQLTVGSFGLVAAVSRPWPLVGADAALLAVSAVYLGIVAYLLVALSRGQDVPCGCFGSSSVLTRGTAIRAAGLGAAPIALVRLDSSDLAGAASFGALACMAVFIAFVVTSSHRKGQEFSSARYL